jgi:hypothetical protein
MEQPRGPAYRDEVAAAYARIHALESRAAALESEARGRGELAPHEAEGQLVRLEAEVRRWDRARTTLAILLGVATLLTMQFSERFGASVGVLVACVSMVSVGVTLAWPSLSPRGLASLPQGHRRAHEARGHSVAADDAQRTRVRVVPSSGGRGAALPEVPPARGHEESARSAAIEAARER